MLSFFLLSTAASCTNLHLHLSFFSPTLIINQYIKKIVCTLILSLLSSDIVNGEKKFDELIIQIANSHLSRAIEWQHYSESFLWALQYTLGEEAFVFAKFDVIEVWEKIWSQILAIMLPIMLRNEVMGRSIDMAAFVASDDDATCTGTSVASSSSSSSLESTDCEKAEDCSSLHTTQYVSPLRRKQNAESEMFEDAFVAATSVFQFPSLQKQEHHAKTTVPVSVKLFHDDDLIGKTDV